MENKLVKKRRYMTINIDPDLHNRIWDAAKKERRSVGRQTEWLIEQGLAALERRNRREESADAN